MPSQDRVNAFIAAVRGAGTWKRLKATTQNTQPMRENLGAARGGSEALIQHETAVLGGMKRMSAHHVGPVVIDGDRVVINWIFEMTGHDGSVRRMDELALQTWQGDRIVEEQFYYDPGQLAVTL
jgi:hypothetical protein